LEEVVISVVISREESVRRMFVQDGHAVDDLVLSWSGLYPLWDGHWNWGYLFTWPRCVIRRGRAVEVWSISSGRPTKILASSGVEDVRFGTRGTRGIVRRKYVRILIESTAFWIRAADQGKITGWRNNDSGDDDETS
jgi:hypothetical protein